MKRVDNAANAMVAKSGKDPELEAALGRLDVTTFPSTADVVDVGEPELVAVTSDVVDVGEPELVAVASDVVLVGMAAVVEASSTKGGHFGFSSSPSCL